MRRTLSVAAASPSARSKVSPENPSVPSPKYPVNGFSTITCLPASSAATASSSWDEGGVQIWTTSDCSITAAGESTAATPRAEANASRCTFVGAYTATTSTLAA